MNCANTFKNENLDIRHVAIYVCMYVPVFFFLYIMQRTAKIIVIISTTQAVQPITIATIAPGSRSKVNEVNRKLKSDVVTVNKKC